MTAISLFRTAIEGSIVFLYFHSVLNRVNHLLCNMYMYSRPYTILHCCTKLDVALFFKDLANTDF